VIAELQSPPLPSNYPLILVVPLEMLQMRRKEEPLNEKLHSLYKEIKRDGNERREWVRKTLNNLS
jgi:hypothetical protein